jgi:hypothetical protein
MISHARKLSDYLSWMNFLEARHSDCKDGFRHALCRVAAVCMVALLSSRVTQNNKRNCMFSKKQQVVVFKIKSERLENRRAGNKYRKRVSRSSRYGKML